ncbi:MAG: molybdate ABC transporter substrate-binding protein [Deltaproteobacteria bacterium]|nr:molybdate ABC transporter substrate-binding protein [Deltaproteobacteria bacterium]MBW2664783.1 molybdate ABC transporter substrate-binding protein [Deltaproteobacteria bacterium]
MQSHRDEGRAATRGAPPLLALLLLLAAPTSAAELLVAAAVSLQAPLYEAAQRYEALHPDATVALTFGASNALAAQLRAGAPIDVLASAAEPIVDSLIESGAVVADSRFTLVRNRLVVVVPEGGDEPSTAIERPQDLLAPSVVKLAIPIAAVPLGGYAREWLQGRGLLDALAARIIPTPHARATLVAVENHHANAAIVYATDARLARGARIAFQIPDSEQPTIRYSAVAVTGSSEPALAADFLAFLRSEDGTAPFVTAGFALP